MLRFSIVLAVFLSISQLAGCKSVARMELDHRYDYPSPVPFRVLDRTAELPEGTEFLGRISLGSQLAALPRQCDYDTLIRLAEKEIRAVGGNALIIYEHEKPDNVDWCHWISGAIVRLPATAGGYLAPYAG